MFKYEEPLERLYDLLSHNKEYQYKLSKILIRFSSGDSLVKKAHSTLGESMVIDLYELESLVFPERFDFDKKDIDLIGVELDGAKD